MKRDIFSFGNVIAKTNVLALCLMIWLIAASSLANDVTLIKSSAMGESWVTAANWNNGQAAGPGNDYFVGRDRSGTATAGTTLRTPTSDSSFPGDSLNIMAGGTLAIKPAGKGNIFTFNNLQMGGGSMSQYTDNSTGTLKGSITFTGNNTFTANGANVRQYIIDADIAGSGRITMYIGADDGIFFDCNSNSYNGEYIQWGGGPVWVRTSSGLGSPTTYTLNQASRLSVQAPIVLGGTALQMTSTAAVLNLDSDAQFKSLKVMGTQIPEGTYQATDMTTWPTQFTGTGKLTIGTVNPVRKAWMFN